MQDIFSGVINTIKAKKLIVLKLRVQIQRYTVADFQGWSKITPKIETVHISILQVSLKKKFLTAICTIT